MQKLLAFSIASHGQRALFFMQAALKNNTAPAPVLPTGRRPGEIVRHCFGWCCVGILLVALQAFVASHVRDSGWGVETGPNIHNAAASATYAYAYGDHPDAPVLNKAPTTPLKTTESVLLGVGTEGDGDDGDLPIKLLQQLVAIALLISGFLNGTHGALCLAARGGMQVRSKSVRQHPSARPWRNTPPVTAPPLAF